MAVSIKKTGKESGDRLISLFNKAVQSSRVLVKARSLKHRIKPKTKTQTRMSAVKREMYRAKRHKNQFD